MMKRVMAFGCFDILHPGHLSYLEKAKGYGDELIVIVARDSTLRRTKGREPFLDEESRLRMVRALKVVDEALLGEESDRFAVIIRRKPDVIALGYDQKIDMEELEVRLVESGLKPKIVRIPPDNPSKYKSTKLRRILCKL